MRGKLTTIRGPGALQSTTIHVQRSKRIDVIYHHFAQLLCKNLIIGKTALLFVQLPLLCFQLVRPRPSPLPDAREHGSASATIQGCRAGIEE